MHNTYTIEHLDHGVVVRGDLTLSDFSKIATIAKRRGFDSMFPGVADAIGAALVISNQAHEAALKSHLGVSAENRDWLKSGDCGASSKTIFAALMGSPVALRGVVGDAPYDADDFGRCARLLARYPSWATRLGEVANACPAFAPLIPVWAELTSLHDCGNISELTLRIRELRTRKLQPSR